jgi:hypothetical protein
MVKVRIHTGLGTGTKIVDETGKSWAGDAYKKAQEEKKKKAGKRMVQTGRGTGSKKLGDIATPKERPKYQGTISSGRGTGSRKIKKDDS